MQGWILTFFDDTVDCDYCDYPVSSGYLLGSHPSYGGWFCLSCICAAVRRFQRQAAPTKGV